MKLLIVEDNLTCAQALERLLKKRMDALDCLIATTLKDGLTKAVSFHADITLLDLHLPDATVTEVIHSIPRFPPPVVVVSEDDDIGITLDCFRYKAQNVLTKAALTAKLDSFEARIETDKLIRAITDAHFRNVLPATVDGYGT